MTRATKKRSGKDLPVEAMTLAAMLAALDRPGKLSATRLRDLRSAVKRVANLLGDEPAALPLDIAGISARLNTINPLAAGMTAKRLANIRSDFLAAAKVCGVQPVTGRKSLSPEWAKMFKCLSGRRTHIGLSRLARYASARGIRPCDINDDVVVGFIAAVRNGSLHREPNRLHRQVTLIWNEVAARAPGLGLQTVTVASFRGPPKRVDWALLPAAFRQDVDNYLSWGSGCDPFAADARPRPLARETLRLRRDQIHAAASALVECGTKPASIPSLAELVTPANLKTILRLRLEGVGGEVNSFNHNLGSVLLQIAREWVKVDPPILAELKRLVGKMPAPVMGLTDKNKRFLRQFDDPKALIRLVQLPEQLWAEVKRDSKSTFRTLAKAQAALAIALLTYIPLRMQNLSDLAFDTHLFMRAGRGATSTLELSNGEVKNKRDLAFDIPYAVAKMLLEYRDRIAPRIIGHRPARLFVKVDGTPKGQRSVALLIASYAKRRAGIVVSPHQFRHLSAKVLLDAQPGAFETVRQLLGHKNDQTTVNAYAGIDSRRAARHHQQLIDKAIADTSLSRPPPAKTTWVDGKKLMPRGYKIMLPFANWPAEDQVRWEAAFKIADRFDESSCGAHLAPATRKTRRESYGRFLGFISATHPNRLTAPPEARVDRSIVAEYVNWRRRLGEVTSLAADLGHLRDALKLICPNTDWSWLATIIKRIAVTAPRSAGKYHLVTSDRLYLLGVELMDCAVADADVAQRTDKAHAFQYRDGLVIALLALIPLRSRTLTALRIGQHLVKTGDLWALDIPAADTKTRRALDFPVSREISARIDLYLEQFRSRIPGADKHTGLWPSNKSRPMCANGIYLAVRKRTKKAFGFGVNLHRFRHAAASFWSSQDPVNVRGVKDVLGQLSFGTTERHYIMAQSRLAGRALAHAIDAVRN